MKQKNVRVEIALLAEFSYPLVTVAALGVVPWFKPSI